MIFMICSEEEQRAKKAYEDWIASLPPEPVLIGIVLVTDNPFVPKAGFANDITAKEIRDINLSLGGSCELNATADSAIAAAARQQGFWNKTAAIIRDIAGGHMFDDANKRTATAVVELLIKRNGIASGVSEEGIRAIVLDVAKGKLRSIEDIARRLRGY